MASITIRNLDDNFKKNLRIRAAYQGRSMEEEARNILREALSEKSAAHQDLAKVLRRRFSSIGGVELSIAPREPLREPPSFQS